MSKRKNTIIIICFVLVILLGAGAAVSGPAIVEEVTASTVVCPGQSLTVDDYGNLIIETEVRE